MKKRIYIVLSIALVISLLVGGATVGAAKAADVGSNAKAVATVSGQSGSGAAVAEAKSDSSVDGVVGSIPARASASTKTAVGKVKKTTYVYSSMSMKSRKLLKIKKGKKIKLISASGNYYKVQTRSKTGYARKLRVSVVSGKVKTVPIAEGKVKKGTYVFSSKSTKSRKVFTVSKGNKVDVYAKSGSYYKIKSDGRTGYALKRRIKTTTKSTTRPTTTPTPTPTPTTTPTATPTPTETASDGFYTIDNEQFGIYSNNTHARTTTDGINEALNWSKSHGYTKVRFAAGTYLIQCTWNNRYCAPDDGILVPSGMTLDLGTATFRMEANDYPAYTIFGIVNKSNVTIMNGTLIGDLGSHTYTSVSGSSTHEWGFGICISASKNVVIDDVTIKNMTGDGVILEGSYAALSNGGRVSSYIKVTDCTISNCRRQGISVIGATDSELARNRIYGIKGTDPQYGIDVETEFDYVVDDLKIHHNTISDCSGGAINCNKGENYDVYSNTVTGDNIIAVRCKNVKIYGNTLRDTFIRVMTYASNVTVENNSLDADSWVFFG